MVRELAHEMLDVLAGIMMQHHQFTRPLCKSVQLSFNMSVYLPCVRHRGFNGCHTHCAEEATGYWTCGVLASAWAHTVSYPPPYTE